MISQFPCTEESLHPLLHIIVKFWIFSQINEQAIVIVEYDYIKYRNKYNDFSI